jgi:hypothetical protein
MVDFLYLIPPIYEILFFLEENLCTGIVKKIYNQIHKGMIWLNHTRWYQI